MAGIKPKKSLGQNFLNDKNIANKIVKTLGIQPGDYVVEIGPGTGALTGILLEQDINLTVVEIDTRASDHLQEKFSDFIGNKLEIINSDIRAFNLKKFHDKAGIEKRIRVIGNIPYNISSDIFFLLFENAEVIEGAVLTVQKELAQRLQAKTNTKAYGILTVAMNLTGKAKIEFDIPASCFFPRPDVTSSVISMDFNSEQFDYNTFRAIMRLVKTAFNQRRKMLRNSVKSYINENLGIKISEFSEMMKNDPVFKLLDKRPENLDKDSFIYFYNLIRELKKVNK